MLTLDRAEIERLAGGRPRLALEDIANHPRLAEARAVYLDRFLGLYSGDPLPLQWASYDRGIAVGMYVHDLVYVATERALQRSSERQSTVVA